METTSHNHQLHIFFLPFMAPGHMTPTIDMANLFASRGVKTTIITTPYHANLLSKTLESTQPPSDNNSQQINVLTFKFPCLENGLPEGCESLHMATSHIMQFKFIKATTTLGPLIDQLLQQHQPDCLVADMFFSCATDVAARHRIPMLAFHGWCYFSLCASLCVNRYAPHKNVSSDSQSFLIPNLPGEIEFTRNQLPDFQKKDVDVLDKPIEAELTRIFRETIDVVEKSYGVLVNSFYELEPVYVDYYKKGLGIKAWHIGPLFLYNKLAKDKAHKGMAEHECLKFLNSKKPNSVVYVCFGSQSDFNDAQLMEIALGLEASGQEFIWVVKKVKQEGVKEEWLPEGFEKRMEGKGLIVRGWAPQVEILEHKAVGGFVTHCGWNSILEGACAGVPMVTWPVSSEQFYNERLVTQVLGIGVGVGAQKWALWVGDFVRREAIEKAVRRIVGEEAQEMRSKARALGEMATMAVEEGGSSFSDLDALIQELKQLKITRDSS
ncbi:hypothetical protein FNV43_RR22529 [Rhamnella rubrinervis]|uniref:Glycosyltransferase n=1 Tax=Rhamnella rubrinervis TaxID=2594499 RepID=A0A8K0DQM5_9ROSA|nr:hypothetical protein FNV43_RR22529 [Rhamnella rubrinervis]